MSIYVDPIAPGACQQWVDQGVALVVELVYDCELCDLPFPDEDSYWDHAENAHTPDEWDAYAEELIEWLTTNPATSPWGHMQDATANGESAIPTFGPETFMASRPAPHRLAS